MKALLFVAALLVNSCGPGIRLQPEYVPATVRTCTNNYGTLQVETGFNATPINPGEFGAQSVTIDRMRTISQIEIYFTSASPSSTLTMTIVSGGSAPDLGTTIKTIVRTGTTGLTGWIAFSPGTLTLSPGIYWFTIGGNSVTTFAGNLSNPYAGGSLYLFLGTWIIQTGQDMMMRITSCDYF